MVIDSRGKEQIEGGWGPVQPSGWAGAPLNLQVLGGDSTNSGKGVGKAILGNLSITHQWIPTPPPGREDR